MGLKQQQVMVVDDDLAMCGFLRSFLGTRGYTAMTVTNADEAVRRFHADRPAALPCIGRIGLLQVTQQLGMIASELPGVFEARLDGIGGQRARALGMLLIERFQLAVGLLGTLDDAVD